ncbi:MAG: UDP-N-acetylmuramate dehydrogenase [Flammeovirgaceae bacterium]|nr:MAG: UDP-N-acetylmuramate dehydrogenase [Flammeovirgaceae bacterium]
MIQIREEVDLQPYNTFGISEPARYFVILTAEDDLRQLLIQPVYQNNPVLLLGGGSNLLFTKPFSGLVIHVALQGIRTEHETENHVLITAAAGENWHNLVMFCVDNNFGGIENLSLIPGTVGAAPIQNIGAYGVELKDVLDRVDGIEVETGQHRSFTKQECRFGYRDSIFKQELKGKFFISSITLRLTKKNHVLRTDYGALQDTLKQLQITHPTIRSVSDAVISIRSSKLPDPKQLGNAGSFFKNPEVHESTYVELKKSYPNVPGYKTENQRVKIPAAWLIEQCGWKGKRQGNVGVHAQQALVLVNFGGAKGAEVLQLASEIQSSVKAKFGIELQAEVNII